MKITPSPFCVGSLFLLPSPPHTSIRTQREAEQNTRQPPSAAARSVQGTALAASLPETPYVLDGELKIPR